MLTARVEKNSLGDSGFARIDVGDDAEISYFLEWIIAFHKLNKNKMPEGMPIITQSFDKLRMILITKSPRKVCESFV